MIHTDQIHSNMTESQIIHAGLRQIEQHGWCQNILQDEHGALCLRGALLVGIGATIVAPQKAVFNYSPSSHHHLGQSRTFDTLYQVVQELDRRAGAVGHRDAIDFNDATTKEDVILFLKDAATEYEREGR